MRVEGSGSPGKWKVWGDHAEEGAKESDPIK